MSFISVLITAIGYCGDQSDGEENDQQDKPVDNVNDTSEVVRTDQSILFSSVSFASFQLCCVLRDLDPILHMVLKQYADDNEVTEVKISLDLTRSSRNERHGSFSHLETL